MSRLREVMQQIVDKKKVAESKADEITNPHLRRATLGNIKRAKEDLQDLFEEYRDLVRLNCAFILVTGGQSTQFATIAKEEFQCFTLTGSDFYENLLSGISPRMYDNQSSGSALFDVVGTAFENMALDMGIIGYPPLIFEQKFKKILKNKEDALEVITAAFNKKVGAEVIGYYSVDKVASQAIESNFEGTVIPIVIHSEDSELIKEFASKFRTLTKNVFVVSTGAKPDKDIKMCSIAHMKSVKTEIVEQTLKTIRENL